MKGDFSWDKRFDLSPTGETQVKTLVIKARALGFKHPMTDAQLDALVPMLSADVRASFEIDARKKGQPVEIMRRTFLRVLFENETKPGGAFAPAQPPR